MHSASGRVSRPGKALWPWLLALVTGDTGAIIIYFFKYQCYYPHMSKDSGSSATGTFSKSDLSGMSGSNNFS